MTFSLQQAGRIFRGGAGEVAALAGVSFQVSAGERVAVLGPSGAGKTTLFGLLNTTLRPTAGSVRFEGRDVSTLSRREIRQTRSRIGTIFQQPRLVPSLTARQNALVGRVGRWSSLDSLRAALSPRASELALADAAIEAVGLAHRRQARADELSGGEQQRVAIARVLVQEPAVVLADEPFASLDPGLVDSIGQLLLEVAARGRTLVVTSHDVAFARSHFPRLLGLDRGRLAFDLPVGKVTPVLLHGLYRVERGLPPGRGLETQAPGTVSCAR